MHKPKENNLMKEKWIKDQLLNSAIFEVIFYIILVLVVMLAAYQNTNNKSYQFKSNQQKLLGISDFERNVFDVKNKSINNSNSWFSEEKNLNDVICFILLIIKKKNLFYTISNLFIFFRF
jgi:hypothetical protein